MRTLGSVQLGDKQRAWLTAAFDKTGVPLLIEAEVHMSECGEVEGLQRLTWGDARAVQRDECAALRQDLFLAVGSRLKLLLVDGQAFAVAHCRD